MAVYKLTAFEANGEKILDESIEASSVNEAKEKGQKILKENNCLEKTHRLVSPAGELLLFHV